MKYNSAVGPGGKLSLWISMVLAMVFFSSCEPETNSLGTDILPSQDTIMVYTDSIFGLETRLVRSVPRMTSNRSQADETRNFYLGSTVDTIVGQTRADIVTEFSLTSLIDFGREPQIDSIVLSIYIDSFVGDTTRPVRLLIHEFQDSLRLDTNYYSDYDVTGKYNPVPLVDEWITPASNMLYEFEIDDQDFYNRMLDAASSPDSVFYFNPSFKDRFPGLYITTETVTDSGAFALVQLGYDLAGLSFKFYHDTIVEIAGDSIPMSTYRLDFNEVFAQKVNIFHHDYSGTYVENFLDDPNAVPPIAYVQGLAGVNTLVSLPDPADIFGDGDVAINSARLVFYVVPESQSGLGKSDLPEKLMIETKLSDDTFVPFYDEVIGTEQRFYGRLLQSNESSAFFEPVYYYNFNLGRHLQSVIAGEMENTDIYIFVENPESSEKIVKFWSNQSGQEKGLRLELIYTKLN